MSVVICHIPYVQDVIRLNFPHTFEVISYDFTDSTPLNLLNANQSAYDIRKRNGIPVAHSYLEVYLKGITKYMVTFDSVNHLKDILYNLYDDEAFIENLIKLYRYDICNFSSYIKPIRYGHLVDDITEKITSGRDVSVLCCSKLYWRKNKRMFLNLYERRIGISYHGDPIHELSNKIGIIYNDDSGEVLSPAVHAGNGYFITKLFVKNNVNMPYIPMLIFAGNRYKISMLNYVDSLSSESEGIAVFCVFSMFDANSACKVVPLNVDADNLRMVFTGLNKFGEVITVRKDVCKADLAWRYTLTIVDRDYNVLGFADSLRAYYLSDEFKSVLHRRICSLSMVYRNVNPVE